MPFNLQIIRTSDFIRLNSRGKHDQEETRRALSNIARICIESKIDCALLDVRNARSDMRINDLHQLALSFKEMGFHKNHRLAILYRSSAGERVEFFALRPGERAEFFAMCASESGWNVQAFDDFEQALEWLGTALPVEK